MISKSMLIALGLFIPWIIFLVGLVIWNLKSNMDSNKENERSVSATEPTFVVEENVLNHNKEDLVIEVVIKYNFNSGKQTILSFHDNHKGYFKVLIKQKYYPAFSALPDVLYKKEQKIRVTGLLEWYQGDRTIFVTTPNQIEIL